MAANTALKEDTTGGLGSFALGEADAEAYLAEEVDSGGIADLGAIRERMAKAGRFDDDHVGHLATGELVVPAPLLEKLPELRESILGHLREMGVEDPERYIVGNKLNSVNPETGMVEFGFFSSVGKAFKSIGKVLKKAAPLIITAALAATGVGAIAAGMIGAGLGTLVQGGSFKDAIISAGIGGITAGIAPSIGDIGAQALGGMARSAVAGGDMNDMLTQGAMGAAFAGAGKIAKANFAGTKLLGYDLGIKPELNALGKPAGTLDLISADLGKTGNFASDIVSGNVSEAFKASGEAFNDEFGNVFGTSPTATTAGAPAPAAVTPTGAAKNLNALSVDDINSMDSGIGSLPPAPQNMAERTLASIRNSDPVKTFITGKNDLSATDSAQIQTDAYNKTFSAYTAKGAPLELAKAAATRDAASALEEAKPGFFGKNPWALTVPAVTAFALSDTLFGTEKEGKRNLKVLPRNFSPAGASPENIAKNRMAAISGNPDALKPLTFANRQTLVNPAINEDLRRRFPEIFAAADGGGVFPRRTGGIMPDEGVPGKDSVRALVMPGEFILTTDAVRGASPDGSLRGGINNMYSVMRNLETRGRRMA